MLKNHLLLVVVANVVTLTNPIAHAGPFADAIVSYEPGTGFVPRFTSPQAALGEPSQVNPFGDAVEPFNPPYGTNQLVSIGAGGHLVVRFHTPILNHPNNLRGLDFTIFGNSGFIVTNEFDLDTYQWIGTPATDSSLFGESTGEVRVSVSRDGRSYFLLNPALAPCVDSFPPTDGAGNFHVPVAPELNADDFAGATLDDIRALYEGSGGGASYDLSWTIDTNGNRVFLPEVNFIRIDVLSGRAEVDAISVIARKPRGGSK